jgi:hypothetical protein
MLISQIRMTSATIVEPTGESDTPVKFTAGLLLGITLDAEISNLSDVSNVRIQVKYPDQQVHLICPRVNDFRESGEDLVRLFTVIRLSHQVIVVLHYLYDRLFNLFYNIGLDRTMPSLHLCGVGSFRT